MSAASVIALTCRHAVLRVPLRRLTAGGRRLALQGDAGADTYVWAGDDGDGVDTIVGFSTAQGDVIDISDLLVGYNPVTSAITNFVRITDSGTASVLEVDADGAASGSTWLHVGTLSGVTGLTDEQALLTNGNLLAA